MANRERYVVHNEVDPDATFHCEALASHFPDAREIDYPAGERFDPADASSVVFTGSTAGVYETERHKWIDEQKQLVRELVDREIPTLGVCFGHQIVNAALGGSVEPGEMTAGLVEADLTADPLFEGVGPIVPALHGDTVTELGDGLELIGSAEHARIFATRHRTAPLWTVQFHPEIDATTQDDLAAFDWDSGGHSFDSVTAKRVFSNFERLAALDPPQ